MGDYTALTSVFETAIPQVWKAKYPDSEDWKRRVEVTSEAEDNFVITRTTVLISPKAIGTHLKLFEFCSRIVRATWDFEHLHEERAAAIRGEFQQRLTADLKEIEKRWGTEDMILMLQASLNGHGLNILSDTYLDDLRFEDPDDR